MVQADTVDLGDLEHHNYIFLNTEGTLIVEQ